MLEMRIRSQVHVDEIGLIPRKGTTDAIYIVQQMMEKHPAKKKQLGLAFVDLEEAFDRVLREVRCAMRKSGVEVWLIQAVMTLHG